MHVAVGWHQAGDALTFIVVAQNNRDGEGEFRLLLSADGPTWLEQAPDPLALAMPPAGVIRARWTTNVLAISNDITVRYRLRAESEGKGRLVRTAGRQVLRDRGNEGFRALALLGGHLHEAEGPTCVGVHVKANEPSAGTRYPDPEWVAEDISLLGSSQRC